MASLPSPTQVSGKHSAIYEAYYKQLDPKSLGTIGALEAAKFLKKSGLSDVSLSRIWDLSDPKGQGCLDKAGFFVALKLIALAQHGHDIHMRNILMEPPNPPKVGEIPKIMPQTIQSVPASNSDWYMKPTDRLKYEQLFESLKPVNGLIAGSKVKGVLMDSKLPLDTLGRIWDLADQDKDGSLDKHEFITAMHLVYLALDKRTVPTTLPPELQKPKPCSIPKAPSGEGFNDAGFVANFPKDIAPPPAMPSLPVNISSQVMSRNLPSMTSGGAIPTSQPQLAATKIPYSISAPIAQDWVVTPQDRIRFEGIFRECDKDKDGLVCGGEVKNVFLQSGLPQSCLALIWALCDTNQLGKLTLEQFCLAMWMVEQNKKGIEPPSVLTPNMIPPSLRGIVPGVEMPVVQPESKPKYSNPELEMISKEMEESLEERRALEAGIAQKEADIRIKSGEIRSLQSELDTLAATLKQLENQKGEAQKRLDDLYAQVVKFREQCQKQEETINEQEGELNSKKFELQKLKDEEVALAKEFETSRGVVEDLSLQLQDKQFRISQVKAIITQLLETQRQMNDAVLLCKAAIESQDSYLVSDYSLKIEPDFNEAKLTLERTNEPPKPTADPFNNDVNNDGFGDNDAFASNDFTSSDPFTGTVNDSNIINKSKTGFDDSFMNAPLSGFDDAFSSSFSTTNQTKDPFNANSDPFGDKKGTTAAVEAGKDDFGSDPFAILHAPTSGGQILSPNPSNQKSGPPPRPESPSPALPPKKSKQPPPRPAPPRPLQGPTRPAPPTSANYDLFGSSSSGGFADFADFDNKQSMLQATTITSPVFPLPTTSSTTTTTTLATNTLQQWQKEATAAAGHRRKIPATITSSSSSTSGPTDFVDDPFKNYRYEDPFNIKDPFSTADDENDKVKFDDPFSSTNNGNKIKFDAFSNDKLFANDENDNVADGAKGKGVFDSLFDEFVPTNKSKRTKPSNRNVDDAFGTNLKNNSTTKDTDTISNKKFVCHFEDDFYEITSEQIEHIIDNKKSLTPRVSVTPLPFFDDDNEDTFDENLNFSTLFDTDSSPETKTNTNNTQSFTATSFSNIIPVTTTTETDEQLFLNNCNSNKNNDNIRSNSDNNNAIHNILIDNTKITNINTDKNKKSMIDENSKILDKFAKDYSEPDKFEDDLKHVILRSLIQK